MLSNREENVYLAMRNVPGARLYSACDLNTYVILDNRALILTEGSVDVVNNF